MLAIQMKQARYGVLLTADSGDDSAAVRTREALAALVRELNEYTRFALLELPSAPNVVGAMNVVAWRSGYQPPIDFWRGDPTSNAAAFTAEKLLNSGEIDAALVICDDLFGRMNESATRALASIPIVALDWRQTSTTAAARIAIPLALPGVESGGTLFRGDGIPLALRPPINSQLPTDHDALQSLKAAICLRKSEK
jgi:formylmethanofuran dehydrogenase subunit B